MTVRRWITAAGWLALTGATAAFAATPEEKPAPAPAIDLRQGITLSPQETLTQAQNYYQSMVATQSRLYQMQSEAERERDIVKLNCLRDKLAQLKGDMTVTNETLATLGGDVAKGDDAARQHDFTRITILYQKVTILDAEADQCVGEDVSYVGATKVDVEVDPTVPQGDPTEQPLPIPDVQRPPECSPFV